MAVEVEFYDDATVITQQKYLSFSSLKAETVF